MVNEIWDDDTDFGDKKLVAKFLTDTSRLNSQGYRNKLQLNCTGLQGQQLLFCGAYVRVQMLSSPKLYKIIRNYPKFITGIGALGGNIEIIFILLVFAYTFYNDYWQDKELEDESLFYPEELFSYLYQQEEQKDELFIQKIQKKISEGQEDIIKLNNINCQMEIFFSIFLKPWHNTLFPLVLINLEKKKIHENGKSRDLNYGSDDLKTQKNTLMLIEALSFSASLLEEEANYPSFLQDKECFSTKFNDLINQFMIKRLPEKLFQIKISQLHQRNIEGNLLKAPKNHQIELKKGIMKEQLPLNSVSPLEFFGQRGKTFKKNFKKDVNDVRRVEFFESTKGNILGG